MVQKEYPDWEISTLDDEHLSLSHTNRNMKTLRDMSEFIYVYKDGGVVIGDWAEDTQGAWQWYPHTFTKESFKVLNIVLRVATDWDTI